MRELASRDAAVLTCRERDPRRLSVPSDAADCRDFADEALARPQPSEPRAIRKPDVVDPLLWPLGQLWCDPNYLLKYVTVAARPAAAAVMTATVSPASWMAGWSPQVSTLSYWAKYVKAPVATPIAR